MNERVTVCTCKGARGGDERCECAQERERERAAVASTPTEWKTGTHHGGVQWSSDAQSMRNRSLRSLRLRNVASRALRYDAIVQ
jgi:hypothetical protein